MVAVLLSSCAKDIIYSCNPVVQKEVKQNLPKYEGMSREEWKKLPDSLKSAAYAAMKPEIKRAFWEEKRYELMKLDWLEYKDRKHIDLFFSIFEQFPDFFEDKFMDNSFNKEYTKKFAAEWNNYAEKELDWSFALRYAISASGEEVDVPFLGETIMKTNRPPTNLENAGNSESYCGCSAQSDWCWSFIESYYCKKGNCKEKPHCGSWWQYTCDGLCTPTWGNGNYGNNGGIVIGEKYKVVRDTYIVFDEKMLPMLITTK